MPVLRPFCSLRNFLRAGCSMFCYSVRAPGTCVPGSDRLLGLGTVRCCSGRGFADALNGGFRVCTGTAGCFCGLVAAIGRSGVATDRTTGTGTGAGTTTVATRTVARATITAGTTRAALFVRTRRFDGRQVVATQRVALVDPDLDADHTISGLGFRGAVVDVGTQGVKGHASFAVPLATCDLDAIETARRHDLDAQGTQTHGVLHGALHRAAEHDAFLKLLGDAVCDELGINFRLANFFNVHGDRHAQLAAQFFLEVLDVLAFFADHHARTCRENRDAGILGGALDQNARHRGILQLGLEVLANLDVFGQHAREIAVACVPTAGPVTGDRKAEPGWVDFLSHISSRPS
eukprot:Opistho-2@96427